MGTINIKYDEVMAAINKLQELKTACAHTRACSEISMLAGGLTAAQLEALDYNYVTLFIAFSKLVERTIDMLQKSTIAIADADRRAAKAFEIVD